MERWPSVEVRVSPQLYVERSATLCSVQGLLLKYVMINAVFSVLTLSNLWHVFFFLSPECTFRVAVRRS